VTSLAVASGCLGGRFVPLTTGSSRVNSSRRSADGLPTMITCERSLGMAVGGRGGASFLSR
jgi:hypothetical protein